jgi:hypothetical protein
MSHAKPLQKMSGTSSTFSQVLSGFAVTLSLTYLYKEGVFKACVFTHPYTQVCPSVKSVPAESSCPREVKDLPPLSLLTVL